MTGPGLDDEVDEDKAREVAREGHHWRNPVWRDSGGVVAEWYIVMRLCKRQA